MTKEVLHKKRVVVTREEADFDRACDEAYNIAITLIGIDDYGHSAKVKKWDRSSCFVRVVFESYERTGSMAGHGHQYVFRAEAVREEE